MLSNHFSFSVDTEDGSGVHLFLIGDIIGRRGSLNISNMSSKEAEESDWEAMGKELLSL